MAAAVAVLAAAGVAAWLLISRSTVDVSETGPPSAPAFRLAPEKEVFARYAGSATCKDCHPQAYEAWRKSHHGLAERAVDPQLDQAAFDPPHTIKHGTQTSEARRDGDQFHITTAGLGGHQMNFTPDRVIGESPLRQFLIPTSGGRWQTMELAFDPAKRDWFDIFGNEDRQPGEWGHWTGRGMNWNQMCASCHNTRVRKNYQPATDTYRTTMAEQTVSCESCHGPMGDHVGWQKKYPGKSNDPTARKLSRDQMLDACGACHARRGELTGDFQPGDAFLDHFTLSIPDESDLFYPDGQVRDEDYEFTSFHSSKMHTAGVRCVDCHEPHSSKTLIEGNLLCLRCHGPPLPPSVKIDPIAHSFHKEGTPGSHCVDCHMPQTTYMQRHARRDHGFTIPDPLLTKQHNIPNACNRCHADKSVDWAIEAVERWYGPRMNRPTRTRAQWIAAARAGAPNAHSNLLRLLTDEKIPLWRASAANLLRPWASDPVVSGALARVARDTNALVRSMAARSLGSTAPQLDAGARAALQALLIDSTRAVRVEAAWGLRATLDTNSLAGSELLHSMELNRDQPAGLLQVGQWLSDRGDAAGALQTFQKAVEWDGGSAPLRQTLAVALSTAGRAAEAVKELEAACKLAPRDANLRFNLALGLNEAGRVPEATRALEQTVELDPQFSRAWYNLGLAYQARQDTERALRTLLRAESISPNFPDAPFARATILARLGRNNEAIAAARRALEISPGHSAATALLNSLTRGPGL
ncbi:MAG: ammonia-forming cytochrome c nitrite reductase subunit c552 [Verrucomicrobia bacterium]|nr:ammonia-forming cytochrome c nitrite reductase subunit c552 [Verrucomicrobiota bacterium]